MLKKFQNINKSELSMVEVAHAILEEKGSVMEFNELLSAVQNFLELSEQELDTKMSVFYTAINTDGSFISLGDNRWGLRAWYPIDSIDEEIVSAFEENTPRRKKRRKINAFATSDDDLDYNDDDPEDIDDLDLIDEDDDDLDIDLDSDLDDDINEELDDYTNDLSNLETDDDPTDLEDDLSIVSDEEAFEDL